MSDNEKNLPNEEESFEDIFSSLREKYNLEPFGSEKKPVEEEEKVFYNPAEDSEIDDFFKSREEDYTALYEEVDAKIAGVDDDALQKEAEVLNLEFKKEEKPEEASPENLEFEDIYSQSSPEDEYEDIYSQSENVKAEEENIEEAEEPAQNDSEPVAIAVTPPPQLSEKTPEPVEPPKEAEYDNLEEEEEENPKKKKGGIFPKKSDSIGEVVRKIIFIISIIALVASAAWLVNDYFIQPYLIEKENNELASIIDSELVKPEEVVEKLNNLDEKEKTVTFESLKKINPDFKAWLVVPGADISLPVVKGKNNDQYLRKSFKGSYSVGGTAFLDAKNTAQFSDQNTIIYGHHMRDGSMFGSIKKFKNIDTYKANPYVYVYTENESYVYKIFAVFLTNAQPAEDNGYVFGYTFKNLSTEESFAAYMEEVKLRSYYNTGVDYVAGDKLLTLSTCDKYEIKDGRLVLVARLVRENEDEAVDTSLATVNGNQKFPHAWYVKKKRNNPYKDSVKWIAQ